MATIPAVGIPYNNNRDLIGCVRLQYQNVKAGDVCAPCGLSRYSDRSVQVSGTFSGATVTVDGTNEDGTNFHTLTDQGGLDLSYSAAGRPRFVTEATVFTKPVVIGGDVNTNLTITFFCRGQVA